MARWSPNVAPYVPAPLDFSGLSQSLFEIRREKREREEREREEKRQAEADRIAREGRAANLIASGGIRKEDYVAGALSRPLEVGMTPDGRPDVAGTKRRATGPAARPAGMENSSVVMDGQEYIFDPMRALQRRTATLRQEKAATEEGEATGRYQAALDAGVPQADAQRWSFGPKGLSVAERLSLSTAEAKQRMELEQYKAGERQKLQSQRRRAALDVVAARRSGDAAAMRAALAIYQTTRDELALGDAKARQFGSLIPKDPLDLEDALDNEMLAPQIKEAQAWLADYYKAGGVRDQREGELATAREGVRGVAGGQGGKPQGSGKLSVSAAEYEAIVKEKGAAYAQKHFEVRR